MAIELDSEAFSVFVAFLPTVAFPFVVSTAGASFFSSGFICNFVVATIKLACACDNSACVFALFNTDFASPKAVFNWFTLSSVLLAYVPLANLSSISSISLVKLILSKVSSVWFSFFFASSLFVTVLCSPFTCWTSLAETAALPMNKYKDAIATDAAPKLTFLIE